MFNHLPTSLIQSYDFDKNIIWQRERKVEFSKSPSPSKKNLPQIHTCDYIDTISSVTNPKGWVRQDHRIGRDDNHWLLSQSGSSLNVLNENKLHNAPERSKNYKRSCFQYEFMEDFVDFKSEIVNRS